MTKIKALPKEATVASVSLLAKNLHEGQYDKGGKPYFLHVQAVAFGLEPFGEKAMMAGFLHDSVEDTPITLDELRKIHGVPESVIESVKMVSRNLYPESYTYMDMIRAVTSEGSYLTRLVKISDNAHNSRSDRKIESFTPEALEFSRKRYAKARSVLYLSVQKADIVKILSIVNPDLLTELD